MGITMFIIVPVALRSAFGFAQSHCGSKVVAAGYPDENSSCVKKLARQFR